MSATQFMVVTITLIVAVTFLYLWKRRDTGREPVDGNVSGERVSS